MRHRPATALAVGMLATAACAHPQPPAAPAVAMGALVTQPLLAERIDAPAQLVVTSGEFGDGQPLAAVHAAASMGCTGHDQPPELSWQDAPAGTKSFALIMHDPDAPTGVGFFHWLVFDLPAEVTRIGGSHPSPPASARAGVNDVGQTGYVGPCPPPGAPHRYVTTVYALDVAHLEAPERPSGALLRFLLRGHTLAYGRLTGTFQRGG